MGGGNTEKQIMIMQDYRSTVLISTPSYALKIADRMEQLGVDPKSLSLKLGLFGGEPWSEAMRTEIESRLGISATDNYGLSEVIGPGVAGECRHKCGMHCIGCERFPPLVCTKCDEEQGIVSENPPQARREFWIFAHANLVAASLWEAQCGCSLAARNVAHRATATVGANRIRSSLERGMRPSSSGRIVGDR